MDPHGGQSVPTIVPVPVKDLRVVSGGLWSVSILVNLPLVQFLDLASLSLGEIAMEFIHATQLYNTLIYKPEFTY